MKYMTGLCSNTSRHCFTASRRSTMSCRQSSPTAELSFSPVPKDRSAARPPAAIVRPESQISRFGQASSRASRLAGSRQVEHFAIRGAILSDRNRVPHRNSRPQYCLRLAPSPLRVRRNPGKSPDKPTHHHSSRILSHTRTFTSVQSAGPLYGLVSPPIHEVEAIARHKPRRLTQASLHVLPDELRLLHCPDLPMIWLVTIEAAFH